MLRRSTISACQKQRFLPFSTDSTYWQVMSIMPNRCLMTNSANCLTSGMHPASAYRADPKKLWIPTKNWNGLRRRFDQRNPLPVNLKYPHTFLPLFLRPDSCSRASISPGWASSVNPRNSSAPYKSLNVLRQFYDSLLVPYFPILQCASPILRFCAGSVLLILQCASPILRFSAGSVLLILQCASPILRFCAGSVLSILQCASPILRFCAGSVLSILHRRYANSSILCWLRLRECTSCFGALPILRFCAGF